MKIAFVSTNNPGPRVFEMLFVMELDFPLDASYDLGQGFQWYFWTDHDGPKTIQRQMPRGQINTIYIFVFFLIWSRAGHEGSAGQIWPAGCHFRNPGVGPYLSAVSMSTCIFHFDNGCDTTCVHCSQFIDKSLNLNAVMLLDKCYGVTSIL